MKIYIACGLTHVPRDEFAEYVSFIDALAGRLETQCSAEVRYALKDSDPQLALKPFAERARLCYLWDTEMVEWADVVLAEASHPSTGLGIELQVACGRGIPVVLLFKLDEQHRATPVQYETADDEVHSLQLGEGFVSLMALGLPNVHRVLAYSSTEEALSEVSNVLETFARSKRC
jgi:nucleoside 2-deoxyribosyltransferase